MEDRFDILHDLAVSCSVNGARGITDDYVTVADNSLICKCPNVQVVYAQDTVHIEDPLFQNVREAFGDGLK